MSIDPIGLRDLPGTWDNGIVRNGSFMPVIVTDQDNRTVTILMPGEETSRRVDTDFAITLDEVIKVGPNKIEILPDGTIRERGVDLIPGEEPRPATPAEVRDVVNNIVDNVIRDTVNDPRPPK